MFVLIVSQAEFSPNTPVEEIDADGVAARGERIDASVVHWCAGVKATPIAAWLGTPTTRTGAIKVAPDLLRTRSSEYLCDWRHRCGG